MLTATWIVVFVLIIGVGIYTGRKIQSADQWSGADKSSSAWSIGCLLAAWQIGGISIVGAAQNGYTTGISAVWYSIAGSTYFLVVAILAPLVREKMPKISIASYLEERYSSRSAHLYSYIWLLFGLFYIPIQLKTIASLIQIVIPAFDAKLAMIIGLVIAAIYTGFAGMKGSEAIGKIVCISCYVLLVGFVVINLNEIGGYNALIDQLPDGHDKLIAGDYSVQSIIAVIFGDLFSCSAMQSVLQPIMAARDSKAARRGCLIGFLFAAPICIVTGLVGMIGRVHTDTLGDGASAFAWTIRELNHPMVAGLIFAVVTMIIAATMATMMLASGTVLANVYQTQIKKNATDAQVLTFSRVGTIVFSFCTLIPAFLLPSASLTSMFLTLIYIATGPVSFSVFAGLLWKRTNAQSSFWSMLVGVVVGVVWILLGYNNTLETIYPVILASYAIGIAITLLTTKPQTAKA